MIEIYIDSKYVYDINDIIDWSIHMRSLVMTISIMNKFYAISHDDEKNSMVAIGLDKNKHFYPVTSEEELKLINSIIDKNIRKVFFA